MISLTCDWCRSPMERFPSLVRERNFCSRACLGKYRTEFMVGPKAAHWKGGVKRDRTRVLWHMPWHHLADAKGYVYRYQIAAELALSRPLLRGEVVHHIDGDDQNDHPDNLQVLPGQSEHCRVHNFGRSTRNQKAEISNGQL